MNYVGSPEDRAELEIERELVAQKLCDQVKELEITVEKARAMGLVVEIEQGGQLWRPIRVMKVWRSVVYARPA